MASLDSSRLTSNILVVIGCLVSAFSGRDLTPVHTRTEIVSVMTIPARTRAPAESAGGVAMDVAAASSPLNAPGIESVQLAGAEPLSAAETAIVPLTVVAKVKPAQPGVAAAAQSVDSKLAVAAPATLAQPVPTKLAEPAPPAVDAAPRFAAPRRALAAQSTPEPRATRGVVTASCDRACRADAAAARQARRRALAHIARNEARNDGRAEAVAPAPLPAVFIPIRNFGYFLQAKFTKPQETCVARADARRPNARARTQACR